MGGADDHPPRSPNPHRDLLVDRYRNYRMGGFAVNEPKTEIVERVPYESASPMTLLDRALSSGASIEVMEKLMALQERFESNNARKAFNKAIASAKAEIPPIQRNREGHNKKMYADFSAIAKIVDPILSKYGLSYRFKTNQVENRISVTCILSHEGDHSEETTLSGPADTTGNKNAIQSIGSTLTYLQRYSLVQMLGLAAADDDDGKVAGEGEKVSEEQLAALIALADEVGADKERFCKVMKVASFADIPATRFEEAKALLNKKKKAKDTAQKDQIS